MSNGQNAAALSKLVELVIEYGPQLVELGVDIRNLVDVIAKHGHLEPLTAAERADVERILSQDPTTFGGFVSTPPPVVPPVPVGSDIYGHPLPVEPEHALLKPGDRIYRLADGQYEVVPNGIGIFLPGAELIFTKG